MVLKAHSFLFTSQRRWIVVLPLFVLLPNKGTEYVSTNAVVHDIPNVAVRSIFSAACWLASTMEAAL